MLAVRWSGKYFFAPNSSLFRKSTREKKKKDNYEAFAFQANVINLGTSKVSFLRQKQTFLAANPFKTEAVIIYKPVH